MEITQLEKLAAPFPSALDGTKIVEEDRRGNVFVSHYVVEQWLLGIVGPHSFEIVQLIRGDTREEKIGEKTYPAMSQIVVGALCKLTAMVDGRKVIVTEAGDVEIPQIWKHDGARTKQAASDAYKRCAMRLGLGLHLWSGDQYFLSMRLKAAREGQARAATNG